MPTLLGRNYSLKELEAQWGPMYESVLAILGSTGTILPIGDPKHGQPDAATFTTVGEEQVTFTWSEAPASFDTALDLTSRDSFQGIIPFVECNGTDEEADTPDSAYFTRDDASGEAWSLGIWCRVTPGNTDRKVLWSKFDASVAIQEWIFDLTVTNNFPRLILRDDSTAVNILATSDVAIVPGTWQPIVITYDGTGGSGAMTSPNVLIYISGAVVAHTASNNGSYVAMEDGTSAIALAHELNATPAVANAFNGRMAGGPLGPFFVQTELSPDAVLRLYELGRRALAL